MDTPSGISLFLFHSNFVHYLQICQCFNFDVTGMNLWGYDAIVFFDSVDFAIFLGLVFNENFVQSYFL